MDNNKITLIEVGPRDGFQLESKIIPTKLKQEIINNLADSGISQIQATSFVNPRLVPQMTDSNEVIKGLNPKFGVLFTGLALNTKGVIRAHEAGLTCVEVSISASNTHSLKNSGMTRDQALKQGSEMVETAMKFKMQVIASIQCSFGCVYEGDIPVSQVLNAAKVFSAAGVSRLSLADTAGMANPKSVINILKIIKNEIGSIPLGLHLHDTRGLGLVNLMAGMECGVCYFDTALGGMGGCPFVKGAAGNIATEDTVYLLESLGIRTGINIEKVAESSRQVSDFLDRELPGKLYRQNCKFF